jgi:hypothetical protein
VTPTTRVDTPPSTSAVTATTAPDAGTDQPDNTVPESEEQIDPLDDETDEPAADGTTVDTAAGEDVDGLGEEAAAEGGFPTIVALDDRLSGVDDDEFARLFGDASRPALDGVDVFDFIGLFTDEDPETSRERQTSNSSTSAGHAWATRMLLLLMGGSMLTQWLERDDALLGTAGVDE